VLAGISGGVAGLIGGAALMSYMSAYTGSVIADADYPILAGAMVWPPWSLIRIVGFVCAATAASELFYAWIGKRETLRDRARILFVCGLLMVTLDIMIKAFLAPSWRMWLLRAVASLS